jgi:hypothetical protein
MIILHTFCNVDTSTDNVLIHLMMLMVNDHVAYFLQCVYM